MRVRCVWFTEWTVIDNTYGMSGEGFTHLHGLTTTKKTFLVQKILPSPDRNACEYILGLLRSRNTFLPSSASFLASLQTRETAASSAKRRCGTKFATPPSPLAHLARAQRHLRLPRLLRQLEESWRAGRLLLRSDDILLSLLRFFRTRILPR